ncbi:MAG: hypothetical protein N2053_01390 [Chitinispirillaceae bacterium]|nr:hypothetical protein [Chitinispirillaceae bacterium]
MKRKNIFISFVILSLILFYQVNGEEKESSLISKEVTSKVNEDTIKTDKERQSGESVKNDTLRKSISIEKKEVVDSVKKESSINPKKVLILEEREELNLEGGEESLITPSLTKDKTEKKAEPERKEADSLKSAGTETVKDSASTQVTTDTVKPFIPVSPIHIPPKEPLPPAKIEQVRSIDFAKNYKEYRSPKFAILLSLFVPGLGQAYAHNGLKSAIFGVVEVAFVTTGAILAVNGNKQMKEAYSFASEHYSVDKFMKYYEKLKRRIPDADTSVFLAYDDPSTFKSDSGSQNFYNTLSYDITPYVHGWDDVKPEFDENFDLLPTSGEKYVINQDSIYLVYRIDENGDSSLAQFGFSENQKTYSRMVAKGNRYFRWSKTVFTSMLINHIVSAIDAGLTAKAYNDNLLGRHSIWEKIRIRENYVETPLGTAQGFALEVKF